MTETPHDGVATLDAQETKKQRKKQAKREAKALLKLGRAKEGVQKSEQKVARAQERLEASRTYLRKLEAKVAEMHASQTEAQDGQQEPEMSHASDGQQGPANVATSTVEQENASPPAQAQADIPAHTSQEQETASSTTESDPFILSEEDETSTGERETPDTASVQEP